MCLLGLHCASTVATGQTWYLENAAILLDPASRHIGMLIATNRGTTPIYIRVSADTLTVKNGKRERAPDAGKMLGVYPSEFVLAPQSSFNVRLVADLGKINGESQSFYVRFGDVSEVTASGEGNGVFNSGMVLAYDVLVAVNKKRISPLGLDAFEFGRAAGNTASLTNRSMQHVFLQSGYRCAAGKRQLADCETIEGFPSQSLLPGEILQLRPSDTPFLGLLFQPSLNPLSRPQALIVPATVKGSGAGPAEAGTAAP